VVIAADVPPPAGDLAISAATIAESHFGVLVARDATTRALPLCRLSTLERHVDPLPVDDAVAGSYGQLAAVVVGPGRQPRTRSWTCSSRPPLTPGTRGSTPAVPTT
jgi:toxin FitB